MSIYSDSKIASKKYRGDWFTTIYGDEDLKTHFKARIEGSKLAVYFRNQKITVNKDEAEDLKDFLEGFIIGRIQ